MLDTIDKIKVKKMIYFCDNFIDNNNIKFSLTDLVYRFDMLTPTFDSKQLSVKVYGNYKRRISKKSELIKNGRDISKLKGFKKKEKSKQQVYYLGKKSIERINLNERKYLYHQVIKFCIYLRELKILSEFRKEEIKLKNINSEIEKQIKEGF